MYFSYGIIIVALFDYSNTVKVKLDGSLSLGKDIIDSLSDFFGARVSSRRSMIQVLNEDTITSHVRTAALCRDLQFFIPMRKFTEEYVIVMAKSVQTVLSGVLEDNFKMFIFEGQLKHYLEIVRHILESINAKIDDDNEINFWVFTMKMICSKFQEMSSLFVSEELQNEPNKLKEVAKIMNQKLIIATVLVELKYQKELCVEHDICVESFEITNSLNRLLVRLTMMPDEKLRLFIRYFYEALFDTGFYSHINEATAHELQVLLNDMAYSKDASTKDLLMTVQQIVEVRLESMKTNRDENLSHDGLLIHGILSDMDHIYSVHKSDTFSSFFQTFLDWRESEDFRLEKEIRSVMKDIEKKLWTVSDDFLIKLTNEVKVFLELTVDPLPNDS